MKKTTLSILAVSMLALLAVSTVTAFGFGKGGMNANLSEEELAELQEQRESMKTAIENKDFESWQTLMQERLAKMQSQMTEENFDEIVERFKNMKENQDAMKTEREQFCKENDCPNFKEGELNFKGPRGLRIRMPFVE